MSELPFAIVYLGICMDSQDRRPIASRQTSWAQKIAQTLVRSTVTPNQISVASVLFAAIGFWLLFTIPHAWGLIAVAICVQLRLLCNLFDGMVAVEGGKQTPSGALYNEFPDRIADTFFIVGLGYAAFSPTLGWMAALLAAFTAYIRQTGVGLGFSHDFQGPLAKQQRMFVLTIACVLGGVESWVWGTRHSLMIGLGVIALGSALTCVTRASKLSSQLKGKARG